MEGDELVACVPGVVETVNKLVRVRPFRSRYVLLARGAFTGEASRAEA
jgi:hypothetical protein